MTRATVPPALRLWAFLLLGGAANGTVNVAMRSAVYEYVPARFHGRTWAAVRVLTNTAAVLGMVLGTPNAFYGPVAVILASGILCFVGCGIFALAAAARSARTP